MKGFLIAIIVIASFVAMYLYSDNHCIPAEHTPGFCPSWIATGVIFPAIFWLFVAMLWNGPKK